MFDSNRVKQDFSKAAQQYDQNASFQQHILLELLEKVKPSLQEDTKILDAGCGTGQLSRILAEQDIIQFDISFQMCKIAAFTSMAVNADIVSLPFADSTFDISFSSLVFQWLNDAQAAVKELERVTKPEGIIAVSTLGEGTLQELRDSFTQIDSYPHISPFIKSEGWQRETVTEYMPNLHAIIQKLKAVGASNKVAGRRKGMMTRSQIEKLDAYYRKHYANEKGLRVTWEVLYAVGKSGRFHHFR
jgi:malonyl-CoA O-methyltransferase